MLFSEILSHIMPLILKGHLINVGKVQKSTKVRYLGEQVVMWSSFSDILIEYVNLSVTGADLALKKVLLFRTRPRATCM